MCMCACVLWWVRRGADSGQSPPPREEGANSQGGSSISGANAGHSCAATAAVWHAWEGENRSEENAANLPHPPAEGKTVVSHGVIPAQWSQSCAAYLGDIVCVLHDAGDHLA